MATRKPVCLVVVDHENLVYRRYVGKVPDVKVRSDRPLYQYEVEMLRTQPESIVPPSEPERA